MRQDRNSFKRLNVKALERKKRRRSNASTLQRFNGFALYEVLIGVAVFALGVIALGRAVENCINATTISAEDNVVRQILSDRMAQVQVASAVPDAEKEFKIDTHYGRIILHQKTEPAALTEPDNTLITGMNLVTLTASWEHAGVPESRQIQFYVYRSG
jgi:Tfp pilus assembly protein PilV